MHFTPHVLDPARTPIVSNSVFLAGPTAVGKTEIALALAEQIQGEIISVDSMQVYRGLDIGTAKPVAAERERVPHHLIDVCELAETFNAARFVQMALLAAEQILQRRKIPIFCGGTGLYFKAFLAGLGDAPAGDSRLRAQLEATSLPALLDELERTDPQTYAEIDRLNPRRVIRAIEIIRLTGKPVSAQRAAWKTAPIQPAADSRVFGLKRSPADLRARVERRVDAMFSRGLIEETRTLLGKGLRENPVALQALGYRQVTEYLRGERSFEATVQTVKTRTWQFARRQMTWLRTQLPVEWVELEPNSLPVQVAQRLAARIRHSA